MLQAAGVRLVVDVRTVPRSRTNPQFNEELIGDELLPWQIGYERIAALGGLRGKSKTVPPEVNGFWQNQSFHNYADYALSADFERGLEELEAVSRGQADRDHVRRGGVVALPSPDHCGLSSGRTVAKSCISWATDEPSRRA